ncbi:hypothetical protein ACIP6X_02465 [Streptomyces coeruleorubidus]|uniref:hypothetical protein n=1 Tax=Streptomyces coeruleorubidus TaxID=116188 RepID=UPI00382A8440
MARVRFIGPEPVTVPELAGRAVQPDEVVEVPDERYDGYVCQPTLWEAVEEPKQQERAGEDGPADLAPARQPRPKMTAAKPEAAPQKTTEG